MPTYATVVAQGKANKGFPCPNPKAKKKKKSLFITSNKED